jgi:hypothetical protein
VTIRGYPAGASPGTIGRVVARWADGLSPLVLTVQKLAVFEAPWHIIVLQIEKTPELRDAFTRIADLSERAGLPSFRAAPRTAEAWTFHVSVLYASKLDDEAWGAVRALVAQLEGPPATDTANRAELVRYRGGREHITVVPFGRASETGTSARTP